MNFPLKEQLVIKAKETFEPRIRNVAKLEEDILAAYKSGIWKRNYAVIYLLVHAPYADIIVSQSSKSGLELETQADGQVGNVELGDAKAAIFSQESVRHDSEYASITERHADVPACRNKKKMV